MTTAVLLNDSLLDNNRNTINVESSRKLKHQEDLKLIKDILNGDQNQYRVLVNKYYQMVYRICRGILKEENIVEDAVQESFIKAYTNLAKFQNKSSFSTWLYRISYNHSLDLLRVQNKSFSLDEMTENHSSQLNNLLNAIDYNAENKLDLELLEGLLSELKPDFRAILQLREIEKYSYKEIVEILGISMDMVKTRLRRAREDLEKLVNKAKAIS